MTTEGEGWATPKDDDESLLAMTAIGTRKVVSSHHCVKDITPANDGAIVKLVITEGEGWDAPVIKC